ncbi:MAG: PilZ domain-containing protein [Sandaracinaceae bacterium]
MKSEVSHVWLRPENQSQMVLTVDEFLDHDPAQRASWILDDTCAFLTPDGACVPLGRALDQLRESWVMQPDASRAARRTQESTRGGIVDERRRYARTAMVRPVRVSAPPQYPAGVRPIRPHMATEDRVQVGITEDVSRGGISFRARRSYSPGHRVMVGWCCSSEGSEETLRLGRVVRCGSEKADETGFPYVVAVAFDERRAA